MVSNSASATAQCGRNRSRTRGHDSRFILEALERNGTGHLWSIDYPPLDHIWHEQIGIAVGDRFPNAGPISGVRADDGFVAVLSKLGGEIDLFIHDSLHSERNVRFELIMRGPLCDLVGAMVSTISMQIGGFRALHEAARDCRSVVCEAEPLRPDFRRFNLKGLFGIVLKSANAASP